MLRVEKEGQTLLQGQATCSLESKSDAVVEHLSPINVAQVQIPASTAWVILFFSLLKNQHFNSSLTRNQIDKQSLRGCITSKSLINLIYVIFKY